MWKNNFIWMYDFPPDLTNGSVDGYFTTEIMVSTNFWFYFLMKMKIKLNLGSLSATPALSQ